MADREVLNNGDTLGIIRTKINANFLEYNEKKLEADQVILKGSSTPYSPTNPYDPTNKQYVDYVIDLWQSVYDPDSINSNAFALSNMVGSLDPSKITQTSDYRFASDAEKVVWNASEPAIGAKGTAFNKNFGTIAGTISEGNHSHSTLYEAKNLNIQSHIAATTNPHTVTKTQVGLGNCDNTSDLSKPVSTLTQAAIDLKANITSVDLKRSLTNNVFGGATNYSEFEADGHLKFAGDATVWEDENFDPTMLTGTGTLPSSIVFGSTGLHIAGFVHTANDEVEAIIEYPHKARLNASSGTTVKLSFHAHTYPTTAAGGDVYLELEYLFTREGIAITSSTTINVTASLPTTAWAKTTITFPDITAPEELGSQFHFRFRRVSDNVADTYGATLAISTIGFHYEADGGGSRQMLVK